MIAWVGSVWRIQFADQSDPLIPAQAPEGRFHHSGQRAIYTSLNPEGAGVAIRRYLADNDRSRAIVKLHVEALRILDLRGPARAQCDP